MHTNGVRSEISNKEKVAVVVVCLIVLLAFLLYSQFTELVTSYLILDQDCQLYGNKDAVYAFYNFRKRNKKKSYHR